MKQIKNFPTLIFHKDHLIDFDKDKILVKNKVFTPDPKISYSTSQILNHLPELKNKIVLDIGCGTGAIGITCLKKSAKKVIFSDKFLAPINNTRINVKKYDYKNFKIIQSDLFENIPGKFDYIFANLPIVHETWKQELKNHITTRFLKECKNHIKPKGKVFLTWASFADTNITSIRKIIDELNYNYKIISEKKLGSTWHLVIISFN